ncbi:SMP-30/gluconolactonase/LRE family protein [Myxococcaceae bacterium JPH2]|nr:SMP-30/gluconolactonase/LRE family protein [Myxococcaceae bacterium JPH2]
MRTSHLLCFTLLLAGCDDSPPTTPPPSLPSPIVVQGFSSPESALHDPEADVYLVSNMSGNPLVADDDGFISRVSPDGTVQNLAWIDGRSADVHLDAPKGMALSGDVLYVSDIAVVRRFDRHTGRQLSDITLEGATFINDLVSAPDGSVYASDMGYRDNGGAFEPTGTDAIYQIRPDGSVRTVAKGEALGHPNGVEWKDGLLVATMGTGDVYRLSAEGTRSAVQHMPAGQLDGIVALADGRVVLSSWDAGDLLVGREGGTYSTTATKQMGVADIGLDARRQRLLLPMLLDNSLRIETLDTALAPAH